MIERFAYQAKLKIPSHEFIGKLRHSEFEAENDARFFESIAIACIMEPISLSILKVKYETVDENPLNFITLKELGQNA